MPLRVRGLLGAVNGPFDLDVADGGCAVLTGPSGVGKSLLLRMIADLDPHDGDAWLDDQAGAALPAPSWRRAVTYLAAESGWWGEIVREHMAVPARVPALLAPLGLAPALLDAPVARLSTGERQRLALVRALIQAPRFLLLDEPTSALDHDTALRVEALLDAVRTEGTGLVIVTHDPAQATRLGGERYEVGRTGLSRLVA